MIEEWVGREGIVLKNAQKPATKANAEITHSDSSHQRGGERQHINGKTRQQQGYAVTSPRENAKNIENGTKQHNMWMMEMEMTTARRR